MRVLILIALLATSVSVGCQEEVKTVTPTKATDKAVIVGEESEN